MPKPTTASNNKDAATELESLEHALTHFVTTFEQSAERWEGTIYPFIKSFEASTRRWERLVYPAIIVIGMLGISGFWLIYSLTSDIHNLTASVDPKMEQNMSIMATHVNQLSVNIDLMTKEVSAMRTDLQTINKRMESLPVIQQHMGEMNNSMRAMTNHTGIMSIDLHHMNRNISRPMSKIDDVMPW